MSLFRDAIDVACLQGSRSLQLRACVSLGRLWLAENRREEALALLRPIYGSFADGFNTLDLREAKALVDDLARIDVRAP
jgi:adenylate cyclase